VLAQTVVDGDAAIATAGGVHAATTVAAENSDVPSFTVVQAESL
jgi:hypothetical protein